MTPGEFSAYVRGWVKEQQEQQDLKKANLYALAVMVRAAVWEKRMPAYEKFFGTKKTEKPMSDEEMYQAVLAMNRAFGGTVEHGR